jgi:hypothetical protein
MGRSMGRRLTLQRKERDKLTGVERRKSRRSKRKLTSKEESRVEEEERSHWKKQQ